MSIAKEIEELEKQATELEKKARDLRSRAWNLQLENCPIKVGEIVKGTKDVKNYKVIEIDRPDWMWLIANPQKSDGSFGTARRRLYGERDFTRG